VPAERRLCAGDYSLPPAAAPMPAPVRSSGRSANTDFVSSANNQFLIRASGGVALANESGH